MLENAEININLKAEKNILYFTVSNKFNAASVEIKDKSSGIGLVNVQRRLNLLYPRHHNLIINKNEDVFLVTLQINLSV